MRDDKALTRGHRGCPEGKERRGRCQRKNEETGMGGGEESVGWHSSFQLEQIGWQNCQSPGQRIRKEQGKGWGRGEVPLRHGTLGGPANPGQEARGRRQVRWYICISGQAQTLRPGNHHSPGPGIGVPWVNNASYYLLSTYHVQALCQQLLTGS